METARTRTAKEHDRFLFVWSDRPLRREASEYLKCAADAVMVLRTGWLSPGRESGFDFAREALDAHPDARRLAHDAIDRVLEGAGVSREQVDKMHPRKVAMYVIQAAQDLETSR